MMLEENTVSPIGTPKNLKLGTLDDGIEVGNRDVPLGLSIPHFFKFTWKPRGDNLIV